MMSGISQPIRVFISYAHEPSLKNHRTRALQLAQSLRLRGVEVQIDQYWEHDPPQWPRWMIEQVKNAQYVLCLASPSYKERVEQRGDMAAGRGARWEGAIVAENLYTDLPSGHRKYIAVVLAECSPDDIPDVLFPIGSTYYSWPDEDEMLYRRLTGQPAALPEELGPIVILPPKPIVILPPKTPST